MSSVTKRMSDHHLTEIDESEKSLLLKTIRFPKSLHYLTERLPKANYTPLKTVTLEKQKFLQTLAGHEDSNKSKADEPSVRGSESVGAISKKPLVKSSLPSIKGVHNASIFLPPALEKRKKELELKNNVPDSRRNIKKLNDVIEEEVDRSARPKEEPDREKKLLELKERELKLREKEKEKEREMILREKAKQKAAEHQGPAHHLLLPDTSKSHRSYLSKHSNLGSNIPSTTGTTDHLSEIRTRDHHHHLKNETPTPSSQSISVAVIKANQFHAGDGSVNYIQNKYTKDMSLGLPRKPSDGLITGLSDLSNPKIRNLKKSVDSPMIKNKGEPSSLGPIKKKLPINTEVSASLELSGISPHYRLPVINYDSSKSRLPPLLKNSAEVTPNGEHAKQKLKNLSKAYNVNLLDDKKSAKRDPQYLGLGIAGKHLERTPQPIAVYGNH